MNAQLKINGQRIETEAFHDSTHFVITFEKVGYRQMFAVIDIETKKVEIGADFYNANQEYMQTDYYYGGSENLIKGLSGNEINSIIEYLKVRSKEVLEDRYGNNKVYCVLIKYQSNDETDAEIIGTFKSRKEAEALAKRRSEEEYRYEIEEENYEEEDITRTNPFDGCYCIDYCDGNFFITEVVEQTINY